MNVKYSGYSIYWIYLIHFEKENERKRLFLSCFFFLFVWGFFSRRCKFDTTEEEDDTRLNFGSFTLMLECCIILLKIIFDEEIWNWKYLKEKSEIFLWHCLDIERCWTHFHWLLKERRSTSLFARVYNSDTVEEDVLRF